MAIRISQIVGEPFLKNFNDKETLMQIDKGGRASAKSSKNEIKIPFLLAQDPTAEVVAIRKVYKDHRDTTFSGLKIGFERLGWNMQEERDYPKGKSGKIWMSTPQGNFIHFVAVNNGFESLKGARPTKMGNEIKILWIFELTQFESEEEINQAISTYIRGKKDWFIILIEYNPAAKLSDWTYEWIKKMEKRDDTYIQHTNYNDLPKWQQDEWLGKIALQEIDAMKKYDYEQWKHIYMGLAANLSGSIYSRFDRSKHTGNLTKEYIKIAVGVDYGESDATTFVVSGIIPEWQGLEIPYVYYHRNNHSPKKKDINDYVSDLIDFCIKLHKEFKLRVTVQIDPANLSFKNLFKSLVKIKGLTSVIEVKSIIKRKIDKKESDSIQERINMMNLMLGADYVKITNEDNGLVKAIEEAEYHSKTGNRKDDHSFSVDLLDAMEYSFLNFMTIMKKIILHRQVEEGEQ